MSALLDQVRALLGDWVIDAHEHVGDTTVLVESARAHDALAKLKADTSLAFNLLIDLTAVDYLGREPRFEVVYHLASFDLRPREGEPCALRQRLRVKTQVPESAPSLPTITDLWAAADWMEREVWDLYGLRFEGHPNLARILLYEEFEGHPLRKDYPKERRQPLVGPRN